ncbi:SGNH/GDSL hydrolase family protein [Nonomuraea longicatena]|uniref:SGNH/GDSL hydrolase family protein n=1 Tax=Nonomuraea longicatena TaxID=83682 RepID=A0ABP4ABM8_9ACTN
MLVPLILAAGLIVSPAERVREYVALGDSWSADASLVDMTTEHVPSGCVQSSRNYPKQVAKALRVTTFRDATCAGATTAHLTAKQDVNRVKGLIGGVNAPQFDRLRRTTDLVTLGIGGNDIGLAGAVRHCISLLPRLSFAPAASLPAPFGSPCRDRWVKNGVDTMSRDIRATEAKVVAAVKGIRQRSPRAHIMLVDYFAGLPEDGGCYPYVPVTDVDMRYLSAKLRELNAALARAARATGATFVDTYTPSKGHDVCQPSSKRWIVGLLPLSTDPLGPAVPFHPNQAGADYQARTVLATLRSADV